MQGEYAIIFLFFSLLAAPGTVSGCFGQEYLEIDGRVIDRMSGSGLPYAHIGLKNSSIGAVSNEFGQFKLIVPFRLKLDTLVVSYLGYKSHQTLISAVEKSVDIFLDEAPLILRDVVIDAKRLSAEEILRKAVENLLQNGSYPAVEFKLEGFYREVQRINKEAVFVVESAFNIYDNLTTHALTGINVTELRKTFHTDLVANNKQYNHNNLLRLFDISTNFVLLAKHGLKEGRTTWAIGKRPYQIADISMYNDREVYVITHDNDHVSLKIIVDANNFSVLRNEYHTKQPADNFNKFFWKYRQSSFKCGFYESHQVYEYREFNGRMYPHFFYRNDLARCFDAAGKMQSESHGSYQALIANIQLNQKRPQDLKNLKKNRGMQAIDFKYNREFWSHYNIIMDLPHGSRQ